jgi:hypothetical protein
MQQAAVMTTAAIKLRQSMAILPVGRWLAHNGKQNKCRSQDADVREGTLHRMLELAE